jgi:predicted DNA-binding transcriptional regulator AlpA
MRRVATVTGQKLSRATRRVARGGRAKLARRRADRLVHDQVEARSETRAAPNGATAPVDDDRLHDLLARLHAIVGELLRCVDEQPRLLLRLAELLLADRLATKRFLSLRDVATMTGWHRTTILRAEGLGRFPRRVDLGNGQTAFRATEVTAWIGGLPRVRLPAAKRRQGRPPGLPSQARRARA